MSSIGLTPVEKVYFYLFLKQQQVVFSASWFRQQSLIEKKCIFGTNINRVVTSSLDCIRFRFTSYTTFLIGTFNGNFINELFQWFSTYYGYDNGTRMRSAKVMSRLRFLVIKAFELQLKDSCLTLLKLFINILIGCLASFLIVISSNKP